MKIFHREMYFLKAAKVIVQSTIMQQCTIISAMATNNSAIGGSNIGLLSRCEIGGTAELSWPSSN